MLANITKKKLLCGQFAMESSSTSYNTVTFLGLLKTEPVDDPTGQNYPTCEEITGSGYRRAFLSEVSEGSYQNRVLECVIQDGKVTIRNKDTIFVSECEADDWQIAHYFGIFNDAGKVIAWGAITDQDTGETIALKPEVGEIPVIRPNQLSISLE